MTVVNSQTLDGIEQFDGNVGRGQWLFDRYTRLPRTTQIKIDAMSYTEDPPAMGVVKTAIGFGVFRIGSQIGTSRMIWARDDAMGGNLVNPVTGNAAITFPGFFLPREPGVGGQWWTVLLISIDKDFTASGQITWHLIPGPEAHDEEGSVNGFTPIAEQQGGAGPIIPPFKL